MSLLKNWDVSKEELLEHIQMLEERYESLIQKKNDEQKWLGDWDKCIGEVRCGELTIRSELIDCEVFSISKEDLIKGRKEYDTPEEWLSECIYEYESYNRYNYGVSYDLGN